jgi:large subunit ribosomal protein L29
MKIDKVREIDTNDLKRQLTESEEQMFRLRFQLKMGQTEGVKKLRELRRDRARMLTVLRQRELETANTANQGK